MEAGACKRERGGRMCRQGESTDCQACRSAIVERRRRRKKNWVRRVSLGSAVLRRFVQVNGESSFPGWGTPISLRNELSLAPPT